MSEPTVAALNESLHDITDNWKKFALYLPGIIQSDIETITYEKANLAEQKIALYNKWLQVHPNASWDDVVTALENPAVRENAIAKRLRDKQCRRNSDEVTDSLLSRSSVPIMSPVGQSSTDEIDEVKVSEEVVKELNTLHKSFVDLARNVKSEVKQKVENNNMELSSVTYSLQEERAFPIPSLQSVQTTDELFTAIHPYYNFLNCYLIVSIALHFLSSVIADKAIEYEKKVTEFMKTKKIRYFRNTLKPYHHRTIQPSTRSIVIELSVPNYWNQQNIWLVKMLMKTLFPVKYPDELPWYDIVPGSVIMTFIALEHMTSSLIESSRKKTEFMRLIGVISLKIGDGFIWQRKVEDAVLSFEDSLIRATLTNNIEAVQFILQYTQVDINTRNTNKTLINAHKDMYISRLDTVRKLQSFYALFNHIKTNIEHLTKTSSGDTEQDDVPRDNFLNGRILADIELLPKELLMKLTNYIQMVDSEKRLFPLHYLQNSLLANSPTPFPGSIEVIISLHNVWSTCSVWYAEQLGQLIFTPTLFYQLQWFRVDRREESVRVCLLADGKIVNCLKECISDNKLQTSMLGVISVQVDDAVMITNDYSDGYTFNEAIELAKAIGDDKISDLLQQIFLSPVDYKDLTAPADENNNHCFIPDPDSTPLMIACCNDNSQLVQLLLNHSVDPNKRNGRDNTALIYSTGNSKIFQMLLDHGADILNIAATFTVMHSACIAGNVKNVQTLIAKNTFFVNSKDSSQQTPLIFASRHGHTAVVELLLRAHADLNAQNNEGWTALEAASRYGHTSIVLLLLQAHADPNLQDNKGWTALEAASRYSHTGVVELLLKAHANHNLQNHEGLTALISGSIHGHTAVAKLLLQAHADPNIQSIQGTTALEAASRDGYTNVVKLLLEADADLNLQDNKGWTALEAASKNGHTAVVELLIQAHADPNIQDNEGQTALEAASKNGHTAVVELLLQAYAKSNIQDNEGCTPLNKACKYGHVDIVELLLQTNAQHDIQDKKGWTPLIGGSRCGHTAVVELLLRQAHANPDIQDNEGWTALMWACSAGHKDVVNSLLQAKANPTLLNHKGQTALDLVIEHKQAEIIDLMCQAMFD